MAAPTEPRLGPPIAEDLGRIAYDHALAIQRERHAAVLAARATGGHPGHLLLLEHDPPVVTVTRRAGSADHVVATAAQLAALGIERRETDRGGDVTYHGPGQLVAYPIVDLDLRRLRIHPYVRALEEAVIRTIGRWGLAGERDAAATGVWVRTRRGAACEPAVPDGTPAKICAIGVRVSRWVTLHGLALNVETDLSHFRAIVPCGLHGRPVTSLRCELGDACPALDEVKQALVEALDLGA